MAASEATSSVRALSPSDRTVLQFEVEQFLYDEAALLDARRYRAWLELLAPDIHYWMPIRRTVTNDDICGEFTRPGDMAFFDDTYALLEMRVRKLEAGSAWSEDPPSRSRHMISNVRILGERDGEIEVELCFHLYRSRLDTEVDTWVGRRRDVLRRSSSGFVLAARHVFLDQTVIRATNMSTLF